MSQRSAVRGRRRVVAAAVTLAALAAGGLALRAATERPAGGGPPAEPHPEAAAGATSDPAGQAPGGRGEPGGYRPPVLLGTLAGDRVGESSGLVASRRNPGLLWTHNDSGGGPLLYCFDRRGGACGVWRVEGARAADWEDVAAGPGPRAGEAYLYVGDIGDNELGRDHVTVYRLPEPAAGQPVTGRTATGTAEAIGLRYPDRPHDAEALLVDPATGDLYLVTKEATGPAGVYRAAAPLAPGAVAVLTFVGHLALPPAPGALPPVVTGGDVAPDGRRVALCTYGDAYELRLPPGEPFSAVWRQQPLRVPLAPRQQGEAIAYRGDGQALLTTSEGLPAPLHQVERDTSP
ncbi:MAG TPA: hypothetical protein VG452_08570 [Egibacteraceae bacterium]|nr:hypothetical protein [Egibacteraceae bacterium]